MFKTEVQIYERVLLFYFFIISYFVNLGFRNRSIHEYHKQSANHITKIILCKSHMKIMIEKNMYFFSFWSYQLPYSKLPPIIANKKAYIYIVVHNKVSISSSDRKKLNIAIKILCNKK